MIYLHYKLSSSHTRKPSNAAKRDSHTLIKGLPSTLFLLTTLCKYKENLTSRNYPPIDL